MFINQNYESEAPHSFFVGEDIKGERYTYVEGDAQLGEVHVFVISDDEIYIDFLTVFKRDRKKGIGTKVVDELRSLFPNAVKITGYAEEDIANGFWAKQPGYAFSHEGSDGQEGCYWFELRK